MATRQGDVAKLVTRIKKTGWPVETMKAGHYRVTCPDDSRVQIHLTPSDTNHIQHVLGELNKRGFAEAEKEAADVAEETRQANLAKDREGNARRERQAAALARAQGPYGATEVTLDQILGEHPAPIVWHRVKITPTMANIMLERNTHNRPPSKNEVTHWIQLLRTKRFHYTHQGVAFDVLGRLQDGQTRLTAIAESGISAEMMVSAGMPVENFAVIDVNRRRTAAQILQTEDAPYSAATAAAVRLLHLYEVWGPTMLDHASERISSDIVYEVWHKLDAPTIAAAVVWGNLLRREIHSSLGGVIAALYVISRAMPPGEDERVKAFVEALTYGPEKRVADDPIATVRRQAGSGAVRKMTGPQLMALVIKGWNAHMQGESARSMQVRAGTKMPAVYVPSEGA
jgi:hypothetical protein